MKKIPLYKHHGIADYALVDDEDFGFLSNFQWHLAEFGKSKKRYAVRSKYVSGRRHAILMHRVLSDLMDGDTKQVDHKDGNGLNNQRNNLRVCTPAENRRNRGAGKNNQCGLKGVSRLGENRWAARIRHNKKLTYIGYYNTAEEAHDAYLKKAKEMQGEFFWRGNNAAL